MHPNEGIQNQSDGSTRHAKSVIILCLPRSKRAVHMQYNIIYFVPAAAKI